MTRDTRQATGITGEDLAAAHLESLGFRILARRYRVRLGEIDLVALRPGLLIFVEVKTRRQNRFGVPAESVHNRKQLRIARAAECFLAGPQAGRFKSLPCRFDVNAVTLDDGAAPRIEHLEDAFRPGF